MSTLEVRGLHTAFGATRVLEGVDLDVPAGTLTAVLGSSGCGKTTLLRAVAGFVRPQAGTISVGGRLLFGPGVDVPPERRGVAIVPQEGSLFPHLDVAGNVAFGLPRDAAHRSARVGELLELVGLSGLEHRRPDELSGGQQQRVALARALAPRPSLVLLDEPFSALDAGMRGSIRADVREALKARGATAVIVTHDQDEALSMSDRVAVMDRGRVRMAGTPQEVYQRPVDLGVARFVGQLVEVSAELIGDHARTDVGHLHAVAPGVAGGSAEAPVPGRLTFRPEQFRLHPASTGEGTLARVRSVTFYGHDTSVQLTVTGRDGQDVPLEVRTQDPVPAGDEVRVTVDGPGIFFADPS